MDSPKYRAFLSYSHRDGKWGSWLHKALESYRPPKQLVGKVTPRGAVPKRLAPIFRDREEFPAADDLSAQVRAAKLTVELKEGETIWTESSHKYRPEELHAIADDAGFTCSHQWIERDWGFAESLLVAR